MIVASYWAESRKKVRKGGKQITVRRHGWSDVDQEQAEAMAEARALDTLNRILAGDNLDRIEPKVAYNGAEGVPIREEILSRHGKEVITRNAYGAKCLNTPDVLIADVDFALEASLLFKTFTFLALFLPLFFAGWLLGHTRLGILFGVISLLFVSVLSNTIIKLKVKMAGGYVAQVKKRILTFLSKNADWNIRVYRTPCGVRLIVTHQNFQSSDTIVKNFFESVGADPLYVKMCEKQACFRARLTAKPWRIGIKTRMKPRPGVWPIRPERQKERSSWIELYEKKAANYAACNYIESLGSGKIHPKIGAIVNLHDEESKAMLSTISIA